MSARGTPHATDRSQDHRDRGPQAVRVKLLGGFSVSMGSRTIRRDEWRSKKAANLVKLLALAEGHRMHREQVMDLLWPDLGKKAASNNLRQVLYGARRVLAPDSDSPGRYLGLQDEQIVLCPEGQLWVDADAFEVATSTARRSRDPAAYRAAIDLYAGNLLPEDRYEEWAEGRRIEFRQLYLGLLIELAALYEGCEEYESGIESLQKAITEEPTLEEAHASLMRLHALSGRPERALAQYERLRSALQQGIGTRPTEATRHLRDEIAAGRFLPTVSTGPVREEPSDSSKHNLPAPRTSFVGREREMVDVKRALAMTRLLTLTGAGGTGKTRLALEVARDLVGTYPDGVWFVELAPLSEGGLVTQEVAKVLGVQERPGEPITDTVIQTLADKQMMLVLDNCEHLVDAAALVVDTLLASCPRLRALATSREPLGVPGEVNWAVSPLSLPDTPNGELTAEVLVRYEAVRLFVERARLSLTDFELTQENALAVAKVCCKLDGIPLGIELATARIRMLAVEQVAQRLEASLDVLKGAGRSLAPRQRSLRATLDWSHDLLSEDERMCFRRLSVFAGGWTLEATEVVCSGNGIGRKDVLDLLGGLVDKSLVVAGTAAGSAVRYGLLEPIRQYALEKLVESGEIDDVQTRHAEFFLELAEKAEPELVGSQQSVWVERLEGEHDNLRAALSWALQRGETELGLRFGGALWRFWYTRGYLSEGATWLEEVLVGGDLAASPVRVKALEGRGIITQRQGDTVPAKGTYEEMLELSRELDDNANAATALNSLGTLALAHGDNKQARALLRENLAVLRHMEEQGNNDTTLKRYHALNLLGFLALNEEGDPARMTTLLEESLALAREAGDSDRTVGALCNLGYATLMQGDYERASNLGNEALSLARDLGGTGMEAIPEILINSGLASLQQDYRKQADASFKEALAASEKARIKSSTINALEGMASLAGVMGDAVGAAHLWGAAEAARSATGIALPPGEQELHEPYLTSARSQLGEAVWKEALAEGRSMSLEEATQYGLSKELDSPATPVPEEPPDVEPAGDLTQREQEVAALVARGFTNRQVAHELSISERTAANHVAKILRKLGLHSRAQIASWAAQRLPLAPDWK